MTLRQRRVIQSVIHQRMSYADAGKAFGISPAAAKKRLYRARRRARAQGVVIPPARTAFKTLRLNTLPAEQFVAA